MAAKGTKQGNYHARKPWVRFVEYARRRTKDPNAKSYRWSGGKGIECRISAVEAEILWKRDRASEMKKPSLDRINPDAHYTLENCRFIEMVDNARRAWDPAHDATIEGPPTFA